MSKALLQELFALSAGETLKLQGSNGDIAMGQPNHLPILTWAICYSDHFPGNPFHKDRRLFEAIVRLADFNSATVDDKGNFSSGYNGWDELRMLAWLEAMKRLENEIDAARKKTWRKKFIGAASQVMEIITEIDHFDGFIPNHPVWDHVFLYRVGQLFGIKEYTNHATLALERVMGAQMPDGCFREGGTAAGFPGSPVTLYSLVSASALNAYHGYSGDPRAVESLEKSWRWFYDFLLPDFSSPPTLDFRCPYNPVEVLLHVFPAHLFNKPEGRCIASEGLRRYRRKLERSNAQERVAMHRGLGILGFQYDKIHDEVEERTPQWPEFHRMISEEACIRRRNGWVAVLSGMTNRFASNFGPWAFFGHERQDCLSLFHKDLGLIIGSSHSKLQEELSTFVFYENGRAQYLHDHACLRNPPPLDTLLLQYGSNSAAISVDTTRPEFCEITLSIHGERGKRTLRGHGHCLSAMAAKGHLSFRLTDCEMVSLKERSWKVERSDEEPLCLNLAAGETIDLGKWQIASPDSPWQFRWPVRLSEPYSVLSYTGERVGIAEFLLDSVSRPTAKIRVSLR